MAGNLSRRGFVASAGAAFAATIMAGCSAGQGQAGDATVEQDGIDYMALVNKQHELPDGWEDKVEIVALSQVDTLDDDARKKKLASLKRAAGRTPLLVSAVTGEGVEAVLRALMTVVAEARGAVPAQAETRWER